MPKLCVLVLLASLLFASPGGVQAEPGAPLLFGGDHDFAPFEYLDERGEPQGFDVDILRAVAEATNLRIEVRLEPWPKVRRDLEEGRLDALVGMRYSEERDARLDFSAPYLSNSSAIFVREGSDIRSVDDLKGREVIVQRGDIMHDYLQKRGLTSHLVLVASQAAALQRLASGRHDAALLNRLRGLYLNDRLGLDGLTTVGSDLGEDAYGFAVPEGQTALLKQLNQGLRILKATGRYEQIYQRWFGLYEQPSRLTELGRYAAWILAPVLLLLALALAWSWTLRRQVAANTRDLAEQLAERQRAEAELEAERAFRQFVEASPVPMAMADLKGSLQHVNRKFSELFGYTREELGDLRTWWSLACPDEPHPPALPAEGEGKIAASQEMVITGKNGCRRHVDCRFSGLDERYILVFNDITARKRAEEELAYRAGVEELVSTISVRFVNLASGEVDREIDWALRSLGEQIGVDRSYVFQFSEDGSRMNNTHEWCAPSITPQISRLQDLPTKSLPWFMEQLTDQEIFYCPSVATLGPEAQKEKEEWQQEGIQSLIVVPMLLKGRMVGFVGFDSVRSEKRWPEAVPFLLRTVGESFANALEHRRVENELLAAHQQLQDIIDFLPDATFVIDREGRVVAWNRATEAMTGVSKEEMLGQGDYAYAVPFYGKRRPLLLDLIDDPEKNRQAQYAIEEREDQALFVEQYLPCIYNGKGAHVWSTASRLFDREGNVVGAIESIRDISDRIEAQERLEASNREMEAFVYTVSHDLRSPLTPIIGYADYLIQTRTNALDEQTRDCLTRIGTSARKMLALLEDLLALARVGRLQLPEKPVDTQAVVRDVVANLDEAISAAGLTLNLGPLPPVRVPETILAQIFDNLIGNAIRYAGRDGGPIDVGGERRGDTVRFHVVDHGPGIPQAQRERIFEVFYRGAAKEKAAGTGIGLAVVQKSARLYGGRSWVEETPGGGATFLVEIKDRPERAETSAAGARSFEEGTGSD